ncbi:MAG: arylsulfatase A-like enzyme [Planctomycetota bacterium]|jgi:arylsulfatase A-like enzyme
MRRSDLMHPSYRLFPLSTTLLFCCLACSSAGDGDGSRTAVRRLELSGTSSLGGSAEGSDVAPVVRASLSCTDNPLAWEAHADDVRLGKVHRGEDRTPVQFLIGKGARGVTIKAPFTSEPFNRLRLQVFCPERTRVTMQFRGGGKELEYKPSQRVPVRNELIELEFDMPQPRSADDRVDAIQIVFTSQEYGECGLSRVQLIDLPLIGGVLPDTSAGPTLNALQHQERQSYVLSSRQQLATSFRAQEGDVLRLAFGAPGSVFRPWIQPRLEARLHADGVAEQIHSLPLDVDFGKVWTSAALPLQAFEGKMVEAEFALRVDQEAESAIYLEVPVVSSAQLAAPCVVLVTSDTHRADHLGAARSGVPVSTPFLDSLAAAGALFEDCLSPANSTNPSHAALMTAMNPRDTGVTQNGIPLAARAHTLAEAFQQAGWVTHAVVSATHLSDAISGLGQGFDRIASPGTGDRIAQTSIEIASQWRAEVGNRPYFLWLHLFDAHAPYEPPEAYRELDGIVEREVRGRDDPAKQRRHLVRTPAVREALYRGEIKYLDDQLAAFMAHERMRDAILTVTSDHGEMLQLDGEGVFTHKMLALDTLRIPLVMHGPGVPSGLRVTRGVTHMDVGRTLLDLAGLELSAFPGVNLFSEPEVQAPRFGLQAHAQSASVLVGSWFVKIELPLASEMQRGETHAVVLYDLSTDPEGRRDIADADLVTTKRLRQILVDWLLDAPEEALTDEVVVSNPVTIAELQNLGYASAGTIQRESQLFDESCECIACERYRD